MKTYLFGYIFRVVGHFDGVYRKLRARYANLRRLSNLPINKDS